jgi:hypothetical protein
MKEKNDRLKNLVNSSGFLFQLAVENEVRTSRERRGWRILTREHPWKNPNDVTEGFIDLVLGLGEIRIVIECKRPKDGVWVFLISDQTDMSVNRFRICWTHIKPGRRDLVGWDDLILDPESPESEFCVIRGAEDKEPLLERLARNVLSSTEALALEQMTLRRPSITDRLGLLIPAIITAADLRVCKLDCKDIRLSDGTIDNPEFKTVPWVRFRKSLSTSIAEGPGLTELSDISEKKVRSIFVISSLHLSDFLKNFNYEMDIQMGPSAWITARQIEELQNNIT